ncbi:MAG: hypothetical protein HYZ58_12890 [Acidobacteria bacterium]|nr:hypothetical protein [Acidobacteriota bacterium]MBI3264029.1 hypothetical protein [Acidobacteriota bacterium]
MRSTHMASSSPNETTDTSIPTGFSGLLGVRRTARLRRVMRQTGLPPGAILDLALELLDIASQRIAPSPIHRTAVGLGTARWRNVSAEERSRVLRAVAQARWAKHRGQDGSEEQRTGSALPGDVVDRNDEPA